MRVAQEVQPGCARANTAGRPPPSTSTAHELAAGGSGEFRADGTEGHRRLADAFRARLAEGLLTAPRPGRGAAAAVLGGCQCHRARRAPPHAISRVRVAH